MQTKPHVFAVLLLTALLSSSSTQAATPEHVQLTGPYTALFEVTAHCLSCHPDQGDAILHSSHWTWKRKRKTEDGNKEFSKKNGLTTFGLVAEAHPLQCLTCHISGNLLDQGFDPTSAQNIDCLVCHDTTGSYKREHGKPKPEQDLAFLAQQVGKPTVQNCLTCHGTAPIATRQKLHGSIQTDIHLHASGAHFDCSTCHPSNGQHAFTRKLISDTGPRQATGCEACHTNTPHRQQRINAHAEMIGCATCHIPVYGRPEPELFGWIWPYQASIQLFQKNDTPPENLVAPQGLLQAGNLQPIYLWDDGSDQYYQRGEKIGRNEPVVLLKPGKRTISSKIRPFALSFGIQFMDRKYRYLISPVLDQKGRLSPFQQDWTLAAKEGMLRLRLPFSGHIEPVTTVSYNRIHHGVAASTQALGCMDCHGSAGHMNWQQLGYKADPWQGRGSVETTRIPEKTKTLPPLPSLSLEPAHAVTFFSDE